MRNINLPCFGLAVILTAGAIGPAMADDPPQSPVPPAPAGVPSPGPRLPIQSRALEQSPSAVSVRLLYTGEEAYNAAGGLHDGATYMNNVLAQIHVDAATAFGWTGGSFTFEGFYEN